ncbi:MAG: HNH endonuclease [Nitrospinota bacterium]|nr:HNH endonuclease [Nitrospinota bacterium]
MSDCKDVPEDLRQSIFLEASNKCAVPTCQHADVEVHHIVPWEECQKSEFTNLIALCSDCHKRAHMPDGIERMALSLYKVKLKSAGDRLSQSDVDDLFESVKSNIK